MGTLSPTLFMENSMVSPKTRKNGNLLVHQFHSWAFPGAPAVLSTWPTQISMDLGIQMKKVCSDADNNEALPLGPAWMHLGMLLLRAVGCNTSIMGNGNFKSSSKLTRDGRIES